MIKNNLFELKIKTKYSALYRTNKTAILLGIKETEIIPVCLQKNRNYQTNRRLMFTIGVSGSKTQCEYLDEYRNMVYQYSYELWGFCKAINKPKHRNKLDTPALDENDPQKFIKSINNFVNSDTRNLLD